MTPPRGRALDGLLLVMACVWFGFALLAALPAPTYRLWQTAVLATEAGLWLAPLGLLLLFAWRRSLLARAAAVLGALAAALLISPTVRATPVWGQVAGDGAPALLRAVVTGRPGFDTMEPRRLRYGAPGGEPLVLDLYAPTAGGSQAPVVVVIHGGSWTGGDPGQLPRLNHVLAARGYAVAAIGYRLAPRHTFPAQLEDVRAAVAYLKRSARELGLDAGRIALLGRSAGGQLALLAAYTARDPAIRGVVSFYGPTDLPWGWDHPAAPRVIDSRAVLAGYLGGPPASHEAAFETASPVTHAADAVPTLLLHGSRDELVSVEHARRLAAALERAGRPHTVVELPWATHGCDWFARGPCAQIARHAVERFLDRVLN